LFEVPLFVFELLERHDFRLSNLFASRRSQTTKYSDSGMWVHSRVLWGFTTLILYLMQYRMRYMHRLSYKLCNNFSIQIENKDYFCQIKNLFIIFNSRPYVCQVFLNYLLAFVIHPTGSGAMESTAISATLLAWLALAQMKMNAWVAVALSNFWITSVFLCVSTLSTGGWLLEGRITAKSDVQVNYIQ